MSRRRLHTALTLLVLGLALPSAVSAASPERFETTFTYTLQDAIADYQAFGENAGDCGNFVLLVDFTVVRQVAVWPDREVRHVHYTGHAYSSADTSRSIVRVSTLGERPFDQWDGRRRPARGLVVTLMPGPLSRGPRR